MRDPSAGLLQCGPGTQGHGVVRGEDRGHLRVLSQQLSGAQIAALLVGLVREADDPWCLAGASIQRA